MHALAMVVKQALLDKSPRQGGELFLVSVVRCQPAPSNTPLDNLHALVPVGNQPFLVHTHEHGRLNVRGIHGYDAGAIIINKLSAAPAW